MSASTSKVTTESYDEFNSSAQAAALKSTRLSAGLPSDVAFHRAMDATVATDLDELSTRVLATTNRLLSWVGNGKGKSKLQSEYDLIDNFHALVVDSVDQLFEKTDSCLDDVLGQNRAPAIAINPVANNVKSQKPSKTSRLDANIQNASQLTKPQQHFLTPVDNSEAPWLPALKHKYHAMVPLGYVYQDEGEDADEEILSSHPYRYEIMHASYPSSLFVPAPSPTMPSGSQKSPTLITTVKQLQEVLLPALLESPEIAIDLEHHSYRTYSGFVCLMQLTTRQGEDFIVDCLVPEIREAMGDTLGEVLANPSIVKVFHGAESDIVWLQQDFGLYVVSLFDTFHASKVLDFPRHGLANLLEMYCDFIPDKRYQLADWRIRPLPEPMLEYARSDTHFLLFVYDNLRNALIDRSQSLTPSPSTSRLPSPAAESTRKRSPLLEEVLSRSRITALRTFVKPIYDGEKECDAIAKKWNKGELLSGDGANAEKREIFRAVHRWRDIIARKEDESSRYIFPQHLLFSLAERPPTDTATLVAMWNNQHAGVSNIVKKRAGDLLDVIREARTRAQQNGTRPPISSAPSNQEINNVENESMPVIKAPVIQETRTQNTEKPASLSTIITDNRIWGTGSAASKASVSSSSSLLGPSSKSNISDTATANSFRTGRSSLFGPSLGSSSNAKNDTRIGHFQSVAAKIHSGLVIAPVAPKVLVSSNTDGKTNGGPMPIDAATGMQIEVPFVPAAQRTTTAAPTSKAETAERDTIVVVGQARQKKKKKDKATHQMAPMDIEVNLNDSQDEQSASTSSKKRKRDAVKEEAKEETSQEAFDFTSVPNILDDVPEGEQRAKKVKKERKKKGGAIQYGDFPAPPRAYSDVKGGNLASTFSK